MLSYTFTSLNRLKQVPYGLSITLDKASDNPAMISSLIKHDEIHRESEIEREVTVGESRTATEKRNELCRVAPGGKPDLRRVSGERPVFIAV
ncbi:unnamed protein product [Nippostrongylus brasiliensis]|uniref:Uncharacterized protein n=1 Tax=Nippostrongylus brasiliensis TaxID=27835 RepID=A0A0N4YK43_NIPBR|nr:unnamed protein product [Nippostrongylus brasiliensis]